MPKSTPNAVQDVRNTIDEARTVADETMGAVKSAVRDSLLESRGIANAVGHSLRADVRDSVDRAQQVSSLTASDAGNPVLMHLAEAVTLLQDLGEQIPPIDQIPPVRRHPPPEVPPEVPPLLPPPPPPPPGYVVLCPLLRPPGVRPICYPTGHGLPPGWEQIAGPFASGELCEAWIDQNPDACGPPVGPPPPPPPTPWHLWQSAADGQCYCSPADWPPTDPSDRLLAQTPDADSCARARLEYCPPGGGGGGPGGAGIIRDLGKLHGGEQIGKNGGLKTGGNGGGGNGGGGGPGCPDVLTIQSQHPEIGWAGCPGQPDCGHDVWLNSQKCLYMCLPTVGPSWYGDGSTGYRVLAKELPSQTVPIVTSLLQRAYSASEDLATYVKADGTVVKSSCSGGGADGGAKEKCQHICIDNIKDSPCPSFKGEPGVLADWLANDGDAKDYRESLETLSSDLLADFDGSKSFSDIAGSIWSNL